VPHHAAEEDELKTKIAIATLFTAVTFITPAHAGTVLSLATLPTGKLGSTANLNLSGAGNPAGSSGYIVASGYDNLFPSTTVAPPKFSGASTANLDVTTDKGGVTGLGLNSNDAPYVGPTDAIVLDLSNVKANLGTAKINQVTFDLYKDITGGSTWVIYGTTLAGGKGTATLIASGAMLATGPLVVSTSSIYTSYVIGLTGDCALDIENVQIDYEAPEPGTFAMAGMGALLVLIGRKKLTGRRG
jgi:hypothetical protein